ncbi:methyl-accepting chemotaxis protein [Azospirillum doebereinerae]|uniref:methyl-accepting chemotaxis protein n=1 Tax=Azospirillum doebereinerae TaxID=92933 RepID=UPI001EE5A43E|nr:methyl-accepting chemotaxis protein [Azospirillum doebereinerae]MCG5240332.1 methyl-accepting chemotaxis protein [Azospirillum doebereinerae]
MKNLSSVSRAVAAAWVLLGVLAVLLVVSALRQDWPVAVLAALAFLPALVGLHSLKRAGASIDKAMAVCEAAARGDLSVRVMGIRGHGNIGRMLRNVNRLLDLTEAFCKEADAAMQHANERRYYRKILTTGLRGDFARHAATISQSLDRMKERDAEALRFAEQNVRRVLLGVSGAVTQLRSNAEQLACNADAAVRDAVAAAAGAERASVNVQAVAAATGQLAASFDEINHQTAAATSVAGDAVSMALRTDRTVGELSEAADRIGGVVALIREIAAKTNMLALNATIEAARAGEAGKGFAVVANEVKGLAAQTARATDEIAAHVHRMRRVADGAGEAIRAIGSTIASIEQTSTAVAGAVQQQNAVTGDIAGNVSDAAAGAGVVIAAISTVQRAAERTNGVVGEINAATGELSQQALALQEQIDAFIARVRAA